MSDYLDNVLNEVPSKKDRQLICDELTDHINLKKAAYAERGFDAESAGVHADEAMGPDAEEVGQRLAALHRRSGQIDRCVLALCLLMMAYNLFRAVVLSFSFIPLYYPSPFWEPLFGRHIFVDETCALGLLPLLLAVLLAWRRRLALPPLIAGLLLPFQVNDSVSAGLFLSEACSGDLTRFLAYDKTYKVLAAQSPLIVVNFCWIIALTLLCGVLSLQAFRFRRAKNKKREAKIGRAVCAVVAVAALVYGLTGGLWYVLKKNIQPEKHGLTSYTEMDDVYICFADTLEELFPQPIEQSAADAPYKVKKGIRHISIGFSFEIFDTDANVRYFHGEPGQITYTFVSFPDGKPYDETTQRESSCTWDYWKRTPGEYFRLDSLTDYVLQRGAIRTEEYHPYCRVYITDDLWIDNTWSGYRIVDEKTYSLLPGGMIPLRLLLPSNTNVEINVFDGEATATTP
ncbi:MAG: hypothetical protein IJK89_03200 [Clostridia bacterium]|nr:hypothetical protein [Clostridia bacterium]